jgi:hypothetical protein
MKLRSLLVLTAAISLVPSQALAYEYQDTGYDPDDRSDFPDIRDTTRRVWTQDGRRYLKISFNADEKLDYASAYWKVRAKLDTRGDGSFDVVMRFWDLDMEGFGCVARALSDGQGEGVEGRYRQRSHGASCRVRTGRFRLTKEVRWKLTSPSLHAGGELEVAPNSGVYL